MATFQTYSNNYERGLMGNNTLSILGLSCLGGIAAMLVLMNGNSLFQMFQLFLVVVACAGFNGTVLAQLKPTFIFKYLVFSVVTCIAIIIVNLFII
jgi:hypothetical protein